MVQKIVSDAFSNVSTLARRALVIVKGIALNLTLLQSPFPHSMLQIQDYTLPYQHPVQKYRE